MSSNKSTIEYENCFFSKGNCYCPPTWDAYGCLAGEECPVMKCVEDNECHDYIYDSICSDSKCVCENDYYFDKIIKSCVPNDSSLFWVIVIIAVASSIVLIISILYYFLPRKQNPPKNVNTRTQNPYAINLANERNDRFQEELKERVKAETHRRMTNMISENSEPKSNSTNIIITQVPVPTPVLVNQMPPQVYNPQPSTSYYQ